MFILHNYKTLNVVLKKVVMEIFKDGFWGFVEFLASIYCSKYKISKVVLEMIHIFKENI